jgi:hypothetical protein
MTTVELLRLKRALEGSEGMLVDRSIYAAVLDVLWDRVAKPIKAWPTMEKEGLRLVYFCSDASEEKGPDDPKHRPVRRLRLPMGTRVAVAHTLGDLAGGWARNWYECSCGVRDGSTLSFNRATGTCWRVEGQPSRWLRSDSAAARKLHLRGVEAGVWLVCPRANGLDDRGHALRGAYPGAPPSSKQATRATFACICGKHPYDDEMQLIPVED